MTEIVGLYSSMVMVDLLSLLLTKNLEIVADFLGIENLNWRGGWSIYKLREISGRKSTSLSSSKILASKP